MSALQPYPEYRDNGFDVLDNAPKGWVISKFSYEIDFLEGPGILAVDFHEEGIPLLRIQNVKGRYVSSGFKTYLSPSQVLEKWTHFRTEVGDLIISASASTGLISEISSNTSGAVPYTGLIRLRPKSPRIYRDFIRYFVQSSTFHTQIKLLQTGATIQHFGPIHLQQLRMVVPSTNEQQKIANFLDHETAKIDTLIEKQQQLIKLLKEKRQAVISHAVTKGLNPDAPMKDSGVEWLGEVPAHWGVVRYKFICNQTIAGPFGSSITKDMYRKSGVKVYGQEQVIPANFEIGDYYIDLDSNPHLGRYEIHEGDVLISCVGTFGKVAIFPEDGEPGIINPRLIKSELIEDAEPFYIAEILRSDFVLKQFESHIRGGTMGIINISVLNEILIPMPPASEQKVTLDYLVEKKKRFDNALERANRSQDLLKERRTALISAAVTGKIDVRNWQAPEPPTTPSMDA